MFKGPNTFRNARSIAVQKGTTANGFDGAVEGIMQDEYVDDANDLRNGLSGAMNLPAQPQPFTNLRGAR